MPIIDVQNLIKEYKRKPAKAGISFPMAPHTELVPNETPQYTSNGIFRAVNGITFKVDKGEIVGYIGPNGAGKSTTIKMLTGILLPTSGSITVDGIIPYRERKKNAKNIGVVFGQRSQLWWDLPVKDSFRLLKYIYDIPKPLYNLNIEIFKQVLGIGDFFDIPVRQLSLGQRMRADIAAALLHSPPVLFLDEPTIGLDPVAKEKMRDFIRIVNKERDITVILTTHDMSDIEQLCKRVMVIDEGRLIYDGSLECIRNKYAVERVLVVDFGNRDVHLPPFITLVKQDENRMWLSFDKNKVNASQVISLLSQQNEIIDLAIKEESIESVIHKMYTSGEGRHL